MHKKFRLFCHPNRSAGAVANALFKATGKRIRSQPFVDDEAFKGEFKRPD